MCRQVVCNAPKGTDKVDKQTLIKNASQLLEELDGKMYTGCDLNTTTSDMEEMAQQSPYVLAAIGNERANPNDATAFGVIGAIQVTPRSHSGH